MKLIEYLVDSKLSKYKDCYELDMEHYDGIKSGTKVSDGVFKIVAQKCTIGRWQSFGFNVRIGDLK